MNKIYIIPGHGAGDSGAVGNGYQEAERVRALATRIKYFGGDNVILGDFNLNSYRTNTIGKGVIPKDCTILELHLDSASAKSAKGGHVIINGNFKADKYDEALAKMISTMFPGRSKTIVGRTDLANVKRSATAGYNYRLMECCFISNADDIKKFNANIDTLAKNILACFNIAEVKKVTPAATPKPAKKSVSEIAKEVLDGKWGNGEDRKKKLTAAGYNYTEVQNEVNKLSKKTTPPAPKVEYYKRYFGTSGRIVVALNSLKIGSSFANRKKIAKANNIKLYIGTAAQNTRLLNLLKKGKLIKP
jgi:hypothetical protein